MPLILIVSAFAALVGYGGAPRASIYMGKKEQHTAEQIPVSYTHLYGHAGMVTTMVEELVEQGNHYDVCIAIGPMIMMKFVCLLTKKLAIPTVVSMNPIMVDGTGMCGACRLLVGDEVDVYKRQRWTICQYCPRM